ncbi:MAG: hypothetical protein LC126_22355 [Bryobacterales bacterium]|nr:hypothetical protein [Bryobacterales bacterium]
MNRRRQKRFARVDSLARPETILATNTSGLSITAIQSKCSRPERAPAEEVRAPLGDCGGNRSRMALAREAVHIVREGIAGAEDVDLAARASFDPRLRVRNPRAPGHGGPGHELCDHGLRGARSE